MNKTNIYLVFLFIIITNIAFTQEVKQAAIVNYIEKYKDIAIKEMKRAKIPASITMAQGILESGFGESYLAKQTNNHFGIKCHQNWTGKTFKYHDDAPNECFRVYDSPEQSYYDHSEFLVNRPRYAKLFTLNIKDYKGWAYELKNAGYATNPKYPELLIKYIETYELDKLDNNTYNSAEVLAELNKPKEIHETKNIEPKSSNNTISNTKITKLIVTHNKLKAVKVFSKEDLATVAKQTNVSLANILKYNDLSDANTKINGQYIYLEPKHNVAKQKKHYVKKGDTMWKIAQQYGIKLDALLKLNRMQNGEEPRIGEKITLRKKNSIKPELSISLPSPKIEEQKKEEPKNDVSTTSVITAKDTVYGKIEKSPTSMDNNTVLEWEKPTTLVENKPVQPFPETTTKEQTTYKEQVTTADKPTTVVQEAPTNSSNDNNLHLVIKGDTLYNISKRYGITVAELIEWNNIQDNIIKLGTYLKVKK